MEGNLIEEVRILKKVYTLELLTFKMKKCYYSIAYTFLEQIDVNSSRYDRVLSLTNRTAWKIYKEVDEVLPFTLWGVRHLIHHKWVLNLFLAQLYKMIPFVYLLVSVSLYFTSVNWSVSDFSDNEISNWMSRLLAEYYACTQIMSPAIAPFRTLSVK